MLLEFIDLYSPPVVAINCDNRKAMGKEKWDRTRLEKKNDNIEIRKKKVTKWKSHLKSIIWLLILVLCSPGCLYKFNVVYLQREKSQYLVILEQNTKYKLSRTKIKENRY